MSDSIQTRHIWKCSLSFLKGYVTRFGVPSTNTSDRGSLFELTLWHSLIAKLGIKYIRTTAYHPAADGMVERLHRQLKASLIANGPPSTWWQTLPPALLGLRTAPKPDTGHSAAELLYGETLGLLGEFCAPTAESKDYTSLLITRARSPIACSRFGLYKIDTPIARLTFLETYTRATWFSFGTVP